MLAAALVVTVESTITEPKLYVERVKSVELNDSPAVILIGAWDFIKFAVGLVKLIS